MGSTVGGQGCVIGAVVGQIAGALYGLKGLPGDWIDDVQKWDNGGSIVLRTVLLLQQLYPKK